MSAYGQFLRGLLDDPRGVSTPMPSGAYLSAAIAAKVDMGRPGFVLELGPGTGVVTQALLDRGLAPERLIAIESGGFFCGLLARRFAGARIVHGDAFAFERYLPDGVRLAAIVSGVPLLNFPVEARRSLIERGLAMLGPGGRFVQLSYGWRPPIAADDAYGLTKTVVWHNLPPAHVWTYNALRSRAETRVRRPATPPSFPDFRRWRPASRQEAFPPH